MHELGPKRNNGLYLAINSGKVKKSSKKAPGSGRDKQMSILSTNAKNAGTSLKLQLDLKPEFTSFIRAGDDFKRVTTDLKEFVRDLDKYVENMFEFNFGFLEYKPQTKDEEEERRLGAIRANVLHRRRIIDGVFPLEKENESKLRSQDIGAIVTDLEILNALPKKLKVIYPWSQPVSIDHSNLPLALWKKLFPMDKRRIQSSVQQWVETIRNPNDVLELDKKKETYERILLQLWNKYGWNKKKHVHGKCVSLHVLSHSLLLIPPVFSPSMWNYLLPKYRWNSKEKYGPNIVQTNDITKAYWTWFYSLNHILSTLNEKYFGSHTWNELELADQISNSMDDIKNVVVGETPKSWGKSLLLSQAIYHRSVSIFFLYVKLHLPNEDHSLPAWINESNNSCDWNGDQQYEYSISPFVEKWDTSPNSSEFEKNKSRIMFMATMQGGYRKSLVFSKHAMIGQLKFHIALLIAEYMGQDLNTLDYVPKFITSVASQVSLGEIPFDVGSMHTSSWADFTVTNSIQDNNVYWWNGDKDESTDFTDLTNQDLEDLGIDVVQWNWSVDHVGQASFFKYTSLSLNKYRGNSHYLPETFLSSTGKSFKRYSITTEDGQKVKKPKEKKWCESKDNAIKFACDGFFINPVKQLPLKSLSAQDIVDLGIQDVIDTTTSLESFEKNGYYTNDQDVISWMQALGNYEGESANVPNIVQQIRSDQKSLSLLNV